MYLYNILLIYEHLFFHKTGLLGFEHYFIEHLIHLSNQQHILKKKFVFVRKKTKNRLFKQKHLEQYEVKKMNVGSFCNITSQLFELYFMCKGEVTSPKPECL